MVLDLRNCYMMFDSDFNEDCAYGSETENSRTCFDTTLIKKSEMCYECVNMTNCYQAFYSVDCENSNNIKFCRDCNGCTDCFGSVNLRNKSYYIFNEPYGNKAAYDEKIKEFNLSSRKNVEELKNKIEILWNQGITKYMHEKQNSNSTGDYIYNSKNVTDSWLVHEGWNVKYSQYCVAPHVKDTYDFTQFGNNVERFYEVMQGGNGGSNVRFSWWPVNENTQIDYSMHVMTSHDLFGCVGLRGKSYCILNKQYTKEEYEELRNKIIEHMKNTPYVDKQGNKYFFGEFFPSDLSPFAYNETTANEFFPLTKEEAVNNGFSWYDREERTYKPTISEGDIPDNSLGIPDTITSEVLECANSKKGLYDCSTAFRIITDEANFYNRFKLPLPDKCPNCRHRARLQKRTMPRFRNLKCANCQKEIFTAYKENTPNLYCKECYLGAVV